VDADPRAPAEAHAPEAPMQGAAFPPAGAAPAAVPHGAAEPHAPETIPPAAPPVVNADPRVPAEANAPGHALSQHPGTGLQPGTPARIGLRQLCLSRTAFGFPTFGSAIYGWDTAAMLYGWLCGGPETPGYARESSADISPLPRAVLC
jgi:hypothetical protein